MYSAFPRFSGRVRGKPDHLVPAPHTMRGIGRCQIEIGPHSFADTSFYEVQYLPPAPATTSSLIQSPWQPQYTPYGQQNAQATSAPVAQHTTSPLLSSLSSMSSISPSLINQVNSAAASNPTLANLLQLAAAGKGSPEQLKTLGLLIQSLATPESSEALSSAANLAQSSAQPFTPPATATTSVKEFDLVFQYYETSYERWILPRGPVICEKVADTRTPGLTYDIVLTMALQPPPKAAQSSVAVVDTESPSSQVVTIRLKRPPPAIWETIWKWVGGEEKLNENRKILDGLKKQTDRVYLAHRIPENSLLTQLRNASASTYVMKSIKPGPVVAPRPKRKPAQRKPTQPIPALQFSTTPQISGAAVASSGTSFLTPTTAVPAQSSTTGEPDAKRIKVAKPKPATPLVAIRCVSCQQTDVPLILGGRFCRPCVDSGKATTVYVPYRPPQAQYQVQRDIPVAPVYAQPRNTGALAPPPKPPP
ncbi:hypothetical protein DFH08DRAFT_377014 [Mycena albidolilacea]|uniref:Uncharacterized protein n=1 Tax=Mycena albidolilacea TaxID=1033008 RepID=A0AAD7AKP3_9AGAR|nr:hypothetical protein DFH08DRAFT_377014 [Mycena albidolilacea]